MSTTLLDSPIDSVRLTHITTNGIGLRVAQAGHSGPLVLLVHGWPECWYSWRHQLLALADAGYRAVAPDMRGYGGSDAPAAVEDYDIATVCADLIGLLDALGEQSAALIGHDWGAIIAWQAALLHPQRFNSLVAMSVPYGGRPSRSPMALWREQYADNFYYILYHNEPDGVAEAEYDADPRGLLSRLLLSPDSPRQPKQITDPKASAGGWIGRLGAPQGLPNWLSQTDLDYLVAEFERSGFAGGINYYRNFDRNWQLTEHLSRATIKVPTLFIAGSDDMVIAHTTAARLEAAMAKVAEDFRGVALLPGIGHWLQQEAPQAVNTLLLDFLAELPR